MTEYRKDSATDMLFKKTASGAWEPIEPADDAPIVPYREVIGQHDAQPMIVPVALDAAAMQQANNLGQSYEDRAKGFRIKTNGFSVMMGLFGLVMAGLIYGVPTLNNLTIAWLATMIGAFGLASAVGWGVAYLISEISSPDTINLIGILGTLNELKQQRLEQNRRYWNDKQN